MISNFYWKMLTYFEEDNRAYPFQYNVVHFLTTTYISYLVSSNISNLKLLKSSSTFHHTIFWIDFLIKLDDSYNDSSFILHTKFKLPTWIWWRDMENSRNFMIQFFSSSLYLLSNFIWKAEILFVCNLRSLYDMKSLSENVDL